MPVGVFVATAFHYIGTWDQVRRRYSPIGETALTSAGKEPAEDAKRAFRRAIELAGLDVHEVRMLKSEGLNGRMILAAGKPPKWPHDLPAIEMVAVVGFDGVTGEVEIRCAATDGDPVLETFNAPLLQHCSCPLASLPTTLKEVWIARREVISRLKAGESPPIFDGKWSWKMASMGSP
jgi:hypothetical protein